MCSDFEEQLELFFIRKESDLIRISVNSVEFKKSLKKVNSKDVNECIPLMLKHVKDLNKNWKHSNVKIFSQKVQFKYCLLYGKIVCKTKETKFSHIYTLDDGTASLDVKLFRDTNNIQKIWNMENELQAIRREMLTQNKNEIVRSLQNLLAKTKEQTNTNLTVGSKALLYGKPTCYREQISFNVYCYIEDGKSDRDIEIFFKDYLIDWYNLNCMYAKNY